MAATLWSAAVFRRFCGKRERPSALDYDADPKRRSTAALIGSPELFSNPHKASSTLALCCMWIVNNSAAPGADLFTAWLNFIMKFWRSGRLRTSRTILLRIVWRFFEPSAFSEPNEPLAKGPVKSRCKYLTVLGDSSANNSTQILTYE
jgi:hypothetical protein